MSLVHDKLFTISTFFLNILLCFNSCCAWQVTIYLMILLRIRISILSWILLIKIRQLETFDRRNFE